MQTREIRCVFNLASSHKSSDFTFSMALFQERKKRLVIIIVILILERVLVINPIQTGGGGGLFEPPHRQNRDNMSM